MDVGMGSKGKRSLVWMRDGDLVKWVTATGRAHKRVTSTYANVPSHTHTHTWQRLLPLVFQLLAIPVRPQITQAQPTGNTRLLHLALLLYTQCFGWRASGAPEVPQGGGSCSALPILPLGGGSLSHEYPITQATLSMKSWQGFELHLSLKMATPPANPQPFLQNHL